MKKILVNILAIIIALALLIQPAFAASALRFKNTVSDRAAAADGISAGENTSNGTASALTAEQTPETAPFSPLWWLAVPIILVVAILVRSMLIKRKHRSHFHNKRAAYRYRIM